MHESSLHLTVSCTINHDTISPEIHMYIGCAGGTPFCHRLSENLNFYFMSVLPLFMIALAKLVKFMIMGMIIAPHTFEGMYLRDQGQRISEILSGQPYAPGFPLLPSLPTYFSDHRQSTPT